MVGWKYEKKGGGERRRQRRGVPLVCCLRPTVAAAPAAAEIWKHAVWQLQKMSHCFLGCCDLNFTLLHFDYICLELKIPLPSVPDLLETCHPVMNSWHHIWAPQPIGTQRNESNENSMSYAMSRAPSLDPPPSHLSKVECAYRVGFSRSLIRRCLESKPTRKSTNCYNTFSLAVLCSSPARIRFFQWIRPESADPFRGNARSGERRYPNPTCHAKSDLRPPDHNSGQKQRPCSSRMAWYGSDFARDSLLQLRYIISITPCWTGWMPMSVCPSPLPLWNFSLYFLPNFALSRVTICSGHAGLPRTVGAWLHPRHPHLTLQWFDYYFSCRGLGSSGFLVQLHLVFSWVHFHKADTSTVCSISNVAIWCFCQSCDKSCWLNLKCTLPKLFLPLLAPAWLPPCLPVSADCLSVDIRRDSSAARGAQSSGDKKQDELHGPTVLLVFYSIW